MRSSDKSCALAANASIYLAFYPDFARYLESTATLANWFADTCEDMTSNSTKMCSNKSNASLRALQYAPDAASIKA